MRPIAMIGIAAWAAAGPFCAGSEHQLWTERDAIADSTIGGKWRARDDTIDPTIILIARDSALPFARYLVTYTPQSGTPLHDNLVLTRIGDVTFGDLYPVKDEERWNTIPIHLVLRAGDDRSRLVVRFMNAGWLRKYAAGHPRQISTVTLDDWVILTDSTAKVRNFLRSTLTAKDAYGDSIVYVRVP
jgi:hypothetical protein